MNNNNNNKPNSFLQTKFDNIYNQKRVLITGHRGFKGAWLSTWLTKLGANVIGYSEDLSNKRGIYYNSSLRDHLSGDIKGDIGDIEHFQKVVKKYKPEIIFHLAAQPLVKYSYSNPVETFLTNSIGTLNVLETVRKFPDIVKAVVIVTTDKCYKNNEYRWGYREIDPVGGYDPYSASKACAALITDSYIKSFFKFSGQGVAEVRGGNVIGGGDWADNRIVPDCIKNILSNTDIVIRNPNATRPWQHCLEALSGYLRAGQCILQSPEKYSGTYNFGPSINNNVSVERLVNELCNSASKYYSSYDFEKRVVVLDNKNTTEHEAGMLYLDSTKAFQELNWQSKLTFEQTVDMTVSWYFKTFSNANKVLESSINQIIEYEYCEF